jgi:rhodanese-related sulfurtransferase
MGTKGSVADQLCRKLDCGEDPVIYRDVAPVEVRQRLAEGEPIFLLDVRETDEVAEWAFPGAYNIPLGELGDRTRELPTDRPIVVACHIGGRSAVAAEALAGAGWPAENLAGGAVAWIATESQTPDDRDGH